MLSNLSNIIATALASPQELAKSLYADQYQRGLANQQTGLGQQQLAKGMYAIPEEQQSLIYSTATAKQAQIDAATEFNKRLQEILTNRQLGNQYQAGANSYNAQANLTNVNTETARKKQPYEVDAAKLSRFIDPILRRNQESKIALSEDPTNPFLRTLGGIINGSLTGVPGNKSLIPVMDGQNNIPQNNTLSPNSLNLNDPATSFALTGNPLPYSQQQEMKAQQQGLDKQAEQNVTDYSKLQDDLSKQADISTHARNLLAQFRAARERLNGLQSGVIGGGMPAIAAQRQIVDNIANQLVLTLSKQNFGGRSTNLQTGILQMSKPNAKMRIETVNSIGDELDSHLSRNIEHQDFINAAKQKGTTVNQAESLWELYQNQRPNFNTITQTKIPENNNTFQDYLTPEAINSIKRGERYLPIPNFKDKTNITKWFKSLSPTDREVYLSKINKR